MNAHTTTAIGIAAAITGLPRAKQEVRRVASRIWGGPFGGKGVIHDVIVSVDGVWFDVSFRQYCALVDGATPLDMNLDPLSDEDCEAVSNSTYWPED